MPKVNDSRDLSDYGRTQRWQLIKQYEKIRKVRREFEDKMQSPTNERDALNRSKAAGEVGYLTSALHESMEEEEEEQEEMIPNADEFPEEYEYACDNNSHSAEVNENPGRDSNDLNVIDGFAASNVGEQNSRAVYNCNVGFNAHSLPVSEAIVDSSDEESTEGEDESEDNNEEHDFEAGSDDGGDDENDDNVDDNEDQDGHGADGNPDDPGDPEIDENDLPVYDGAPISVADCLLSILVYGFTHNLSGEAFGGLLELMNLNMGPNSRLKKSAYHFWRFFEDMQGVPSHYHYYCSSCISPLANQDAECAQCEDHPTKNYFIELGISEQLQSMLQRPGFADLLNYQYTRVKQNADGIEDIYDGILYKEHRQRNNPDGNKFTLSFMWYSDGAPVFKSRKYSVWPLYFVINELPYSERIKKENIIIAGLWFGPTDPDVNFFLEPTYWQMAKLQNDGISFHIRGYPNNEPQLVKAFLLCGTGDAPARADFLNHTRFNGKYGCLHCYSPGYNIAGNSERKSTHIYPYEGDSMPRTHQLQQIHGQQALQDDKPTFGVKGPTILSLMMPDTVRGISIDSMHCGHLGVDKRFLSLWFDPSLKNEPFSLCNVKDVIDARFLAIKPPNYIKRMPRSLVNHLHYFKASELRTWFYFYAIPVLDGIMKDEYFHHYLQFLLGVYLLNQSSISEDQIAQSRQLLSAFVSKFHILYDAKYNTFNLHSLLHLPDVVKNLGPLWVTSCFPFEDILGTMVGYVHGTRYAGLQIFTKIMRHQVILSKLHELDENSSVKQLCQKFLTRGKRIDPDRRINETCFVLGKIKKLHRISDNLRRHLTAAGVDFERENVNVFNFKKLKKSKMVIFSRRTGKNNQTYSSCISVTTENRHKVGFAELFYKVCYCNRNELCRINCDNNALVFVLFREAIVENHYKVPLNMSLIDDINENDIQWVEFPNIFTMLEVREEYEMISVDKIDCINCFIKVNDVMTIVRPPNIIEYAE